MSIFPPVDALAAIEQGYYPQAVFLLERAIEEAPDVKVNYWYLGLAFLLQQQEIEAQTTWMMALADGEAEEVEIWTEELCQILELEASKQEQKSNLELALGIRQYIRELSPLNLSNLLKLMSLAILTQSFTGKELVEYNILEILQSAEAEKIDQGLLLNTLIIGLKNVAPLPAILDFTRVCFQVAENLEILDNFILEVIYHLIDLAYAQRQPFLAARYGEVCHEFYPNSLTILRHLVNFYQYDSNYAKGLEYARLRASLPQSTPEKINSNHLILNILMKMGGYWKEAKEALQKQEELWQEFIENPTFEFSENTTLSLFSCLFPLPYLQDEPRKIQIIKNEVSAICQKQIQNYAPQVLENYQPKSVVSPLIQSSKSLKIGYLSGFLKTHSVGWLARWLLKHHDKEKFQFYGYLINVTKKEDKIQKFCMNQFHRAYQCGIEFWDIAKQIQQDEVDILVDLDSITLDITCGVMCLKPAPIQVTWLGWDASGIPAIDYYMADDYVLPETAQDYYSEKIWRLPNSYIAVDGFEVGVPSLRRSDLDIPENAVVYLSAQSGFKRNQETARLQIKILKEVPNSYFLIKGISEEESVKRFFTQIAEEEGVNPQRLRFLPLVGSEEEHRANLQIADIVLDTFPYNGATTTLETLWMGIPLVTLVGQQFAARNSYTMMVNAGISEGIAWTEDEYIEWGVRFGKDEKLRQEVAWKLRQSRHHAPLWNTRQFAREMEKAYEEMWRLARG